MIAILTGDIINSKKGEAEKWLIPLKETLEKWLMPLKETLAHYGKENKNWSIYRGDSFQLSLPVEQALSAAIHIKLTVKTTALYDVRIAIGIGNENYKALKITESNGSAYVNSGECFEALKKRTLAIKSNDSHFDTTLNTMLSTFTLIADNWSSSTSKILKFFVENTDKKQVEVANLLQKSQSNISETLKRGAYEEFKMIDKFYQENVVKL